HCKTCGTVIPMPRIGQRYCSQNCKQAAYRNRSKRAVAVTRKRRLYPTTGCRNENTEFPHGNQRSFLPPTYCFAAPRSMPPKSKGMMPPGPPPPLSWIEIAVLGGHVVKVNQRPYTLQTSRHVCADDAMGPTPGALQGDDYPLTYDADG